MRNRLFSEKLVLPLTIIMLTIGATNPSPVFAFGKNTASQTSGETIKSTVLENFTPPDIFIDNAQISKEIIMSNIKFSCVQSRIFHTGGSCDDFASKSIKGIVNVIVGRELLAREARRTALTVDENDFDNYFSNRINALGGSEALGNIFAEFNIDFDQYRAISKHAFIAREYSEKVLLKDSPLTEKVIRSYYDKNISDYTKVEERIVDFVMFYLPAGPDSDVVSFIKDAPSEIHSRDDLTSFIVKLKLRHLRKTRKQTAFDIVYRPDRGGKFWDVVKGIERAGQAVYYENETRDRKEHFIFLLSEVIPEEITPYENERDKIRKKLNTEWPSKVIGEKVNLLRDRSDIKIIYH